MQFILVLGLLGVGAAWWLRSHSYKDGEGPFDQLPSGASGKPAGSRDEQSSDGTRYRVYYWPPTAANQQFHVAELRGKPAWVSFWFDRGGGRRTLYRSLASAGELNDMRKDWAI